MEAHVSRVLGSGRHPEWDRREVGLESTPVRSRQCKTHDSRVGADEEVRERHCRCAGLGAASFSVPAVGPGADIGGCRGYVENLNAPSPNPIGDGGRLSVTHADLGQAHRVNGGALVRYCVCDHVSSPGAEWRFGVEGVDQDVGIEQNHDSRVSSRSRSQDMVGRNGASHIASRHASRLMGPGASGFVSRTRMKRPSFCCWMSKTSPGRPYGSTILFLESTVEVLMVGLSHIVASTSMNPPFEEEDL